MGPHSDRNRNHNTFHMQKNLGLSTTFLGEAYGIEDALYSAIRVLIVCGRFDYHTVDNDNHRLLGPHEYYVHQPPDGPNYSMP